MSSKPLSSELGGSDRGRSGSTSRGRLRGLLSPKKNRESKESGNYAAPEFADDGRTETRSSLQNRGRTASPSKIRDRASGVVSGTSSKKARSQSSKGASSRGYNRPSDAYLGSDLEGDWDKGDHSEVDNSASDVVESPRGGAFAAAADAPSQQTDEPQTDEQQTDDAGFSTETGSYDQRLNRTFSAGTATEYTVTTGTGTEYTQSDGLSTGESGAEHRRNRARGDARPTIKRYRGFSTSISSLFLDEQIVCGAVACCGLLVSQRTEHLLNERNLNRGLMRRGSKRGGERTPSRFLGITLFLTLLFIAFSYFIWGFPESGALVSGGISYQGKPYNTDDAVDDDIHQGDDLVKADDAAADDIGFNDDGKDDIDDYYSAPDDNYWGRNDDYAKKDDDAAANDDHGDDDQNDHADADDAVQDAGDDAEENDQGNDQQDNANDDANDDADAGNQRRMRGYFSLEPTQIYPSNKKTWGTHAGHHRPKRGMCKRQNPTFIGLAKTREYHDIFWCPFFHFLDREWTSRRTTKHVHPQRDRKIKRRTHTTTQNPPRKNQIPMLATGNKLRHLEDYGNEGYSNGDDLYNDLYDDDGNDKEELDVGSLARAVICLIFLLLLGIVGRRRRMRTRFALLRARAQDDHVYYSPAMHPAGIDDEIASAGSQLSATPSIVEEMKREDKYDGACSHTLCGFYPTDPPQYHDYFTSVDDDSNDDDDGNVNGRKRGRKGYADCMSRFNDCISAMCCGFCFKCWVQCFSICALAQEAREVRILVQPRLQRVDYITHQPFHSYYRDIYELRRRWMGLTPSNGSRRSRISGGIMPHIGALSRLTRYILLYSVLAVVLVTATAKYNPNSTFTWNDAVVVAATFGQSFLILLFVHCIFHKSDLSFDAVLKFFAAGFAIALPTAVVIQAIILNFSVTIIYFGYSILYWLIGDSFGGWINYYYRILWMSLDVFMAFLVVALAEELCKYYAFRFVEHPDLIFLTGLDRSTFKGDASRHMGGQSRYPFSSHNLSETDRSNSFDSEFSKSLENKKGRASKRGRHISDDDDDDTVLSNATGESVFDKEVDVRTVRQRAAAVTTAMISTAVGFACAENFLYVFLLGGDGGNSTLEEWLILLFRSIFPIHALCAALQSIGVIQKFLENLPLAVRRHLGVGKIIFPAVLLHGTFDAVLFCINVFVETSWDNYYATIDAGGNPREPYNTLLLNIVGAAGIVGSMLFGVVWYYIQRRNQSDRLKDVERSERLRLVDSNDETETEPSADPFSNKYKSPNPTSKKKTSNRTGA